MRRLADAIAKQKANGGRAVQLQIDGGVKAHNIAELRSWGVTNAVVGSGLFNDRASVADNGRTHCCLARVRDSDAHPGAQRDTLPTNVARGTFVAIHVRLLRDANHDVRVVSPLPRMLQYQESRRSTLPAAKAPDSTFDGTEVLVPRYWGLSNQASAWLTASSIRRRASAVQRWLGDWRPEAVVVPPCGRLEAWLALAKAWNVPCIGVVHGWDLDVGLAHRDVGPRLRRMIADLDRNCSLLKNGVDTSPT